jgi:type 1 glutamine amidotransferase
VATRLNSLLITQNIMIHRLLLITLLLATTAFAAERHVVFMIGEDEYKTWETLPDFAAKDLKAAGYRTTIISGDSADKNNFPGLVAALKDADLLFISVRRRTPPKEQLDAVRAHLDAGKPLVGIRTASHAFALRPKDKLADPKLAAWQEFDPQVLGGHYANHHGNGPKTTVTAAPGAEKHSILSGISLADFLSNGSLYKVSPLEKTASPLLIGTIPGQPSEPVAWTHLYGTKAARVFYTSLGHPDDFQNPEFRRLLVNGIAWALNK